MQLEKCLGHDDRIVLPLGSTEQHAYLSLATDSILAERVSVEAAEPLGVPVLPALAYGVTRRFTAYPGTLTLAPETYVEALRELIDSLRAQGFARVLVVNGHGGNSFAREHVDVPWHDWWVGPRVWELVQALDPDSAHASWMENFPWTRLDGVDVPRGRKPRTFPTSDEPAAVRAELGDGSFGGAYARPDEDVRRLWSTAVDEVRAFLQA